MDWRTHLADRLRDMRPASVCVLDEAARRLAAASLPDTPLRDFGEPGQPCALALGVDALTGLDAAAAAQLISRVRLYAAPRLLIAAQPGCALDADAFRALGFSCSLTDDAAQVRIHHYDLDTYKTVPDWLNARFWANPERWEP